MPRIHALEQPSPAHCSNQRHAGPGCCRSPPHQAAKLPAPATHAPGRFQPATGAHPRHRQRQPSAASATSPVGLIPPHSHRERFGAGPDRQRFAAAGCFYRCRGHHPPAPANPAPSPHPRPGRARQTLCQGAARPAPPPRPWPLNGEGWVQQPGRSVGGGDHRAAGHCSAPPGCSSYRRRNSVQKTGGSGLRSFDRRRW